MLVLYFVIGCVAGGITQYLDAEGTSFEYSIFVVIWPLFVIFIFLDIIIPKIKKSISYVMTLVLGHNYTPWALIARLLNHIESKMK
jgi:hypothetical protein